MGLEQEEFLPPVLHLKPGFAKLLIPCLLSDLGLEIFPPTID